MDKIRKKRSIDLDVVNSEAFLEQARSAQALYFHLCVRADDWGFITAPKPLIRYLNASEKDLKALIDAKFLHRFPSGVVVIMDWPIHNSVRKDRVAKTICTEEFKQLSCEKRHRYELKDQNTAAIPEPGTAGEATTSPASVHSAAQSAAATQPRGGAKKRAAGNALGKAASPTSAPAAVQQGTSASPQVSPQVERAQRPSGAPGQTATSQANARPAASMPSQGRTDRSQGEAAVASSGRQPSTQSTAAERTNSSAIMPNRQQGVNQSGDTQVADTSPDDPRHVHNLAQILTQFGLTPEQVDDILSVYGVRDLSESKLQYACEYAREHAEKNPAGYLKVLLSNHRLKFDVPNNAPQK